MDKLKELKKLYEIAKKNESVGIALHILHEISEIEFREKEQDPMVVAVEQYLEKDMPNG